jgi:hypothetical protein
MNTKAPEVMRISPTVENRNPESWFAIVQYNTAPIAAAIAPLTRPRRPTAHLLFLPDWVTGEKDAGSWRPDSERSSARTIPFIGANRVSKSRQDGTVLSAGPSPVTRSLSSTTSMRRRGANGKTNLDVTLEHRGLAPIAMRASRTMMALSRRIALPSSGAPVERWSICD